MSVAYFVNRYAKWRHHDAWRHAGSFTGQTPDLAPPRSVEDKYLWRKMFDHDPLHVTVSDKLAVKNYVRAKTPEIGIPETLWSGDDLGDMPRGLIGSGALLKINNASGRTLLLTDPGYNLDELRAHTKDWKTPYGVGLREWAYGQIEPRFLLEGLIPGSTTGLVKEHRMHCFGGEILFVLSSTHPAIQLTPQAHFSRLTTSGTEETIRTTHAIDGTPMFNIYSPEMELLPADFTGMDAVFDFARRLAADFDAVRVDLYKHDDEIYFGELTLYPNAGGLFFGDAYRETASDMWDLRDTWFLTTPQPGWRGAYAKWLRRKLGPRKSRGAA